MEIDKVALHAASQPLCLHLTQREVGQCDLILGVEPPGLNTDYSVCVLFLRSQVTLGLYFISTAAQHRPLLTSFSSGFYHLQPLPGPGYQIISQTDSRHEAVGGDQLGPHYDLRNKNSLHCLYLTRHDSTASTQLDHHHFSDLFLLSY